ncbi:uncharacterized protein [Anser cygnoides]|uniref:uncharacterized protein n=1 Tax=Anser cygnoides TaxID=8845 RepID=UPI0034D2449B
MKYNTACSLDKCPKSLISLWTWCRNPLAASFVQTLKKRGVTWSEEGAVLTTQDICNSPGDLPAPAFFLNTSRAQEGELVSLRCTLDGPSVPSRIVFCKGRMEAHSLKGQLGKLIYTIILDVTQGTEGVYTCGYQLKDDSNRVRSSALSAGRILDVPGVGAGETTQDIRSSPAPHARLPHALPTGTALAVAAVGLVLLAAGSWFAIRKGACRGRCPRPLHGAGSDEDSSADPSQYYANVDEMGRVKLSQSICSQH